MIRNIFSRNGGEKPVNRLSQGLAAAFFTTTMLYGGLVQAQEAPEVNAQTVSLEQADGCAALQLNQHGLRLDDSGSAFQYAQQQSGRIGISIAPGNDLNGYTPDQIGAYFVNMFAGAGIEAQCYIGSNPLPSPTAVGFYVNGVAWEQEKFLNLEQATNANTLRGLVAEAKTGKALLAPVDVAYNSRQP